MDTPGHNYQLRKSYSLLRQGLVNCFSEMTYWDFSGKQDDPAETCALLVSVIAVGTPRTEERKGEFWHGGAPNRVFVRQ